VPATAGPPGAAGERGAQFSWGTTPSRLAARIAPARSGSSPVSVSLRREKRSLEHPAVQAQTHRALTESGPSSSAPAGVSSVRRLVLAPALLLGEPWNPCGARRSQRLPTPPKFPGEGGGPGLAQPSACQAVPPARTVSSWRTGPSTLLRFPGQAVRRGGAAPPAQGSRLARLMLCPEASGWRVTAPLALQAPAELHGAQPLRPDQSRSTGICFRSVARRRLGSASAAPLEADAGPRGTPPAIDPKRQQPRPAKAGPLAFAWKREVAWKPVGVDLEAGP